MPELPEVETFVRFLKTKIQGKTIVKSRFFFDSLLKNPSITEFNKQISFQKIEKISRRGKFILIHLKDYVLIIHLRMEGKLVVYKSVQEPLVNRYVSARFYLDDHCYLDFEDSRKFGTMHLEKKETYTQIPGLKKLGLEPFSKKLNSHYLKENWKRFSRPIKVVLLDQTVIVGIGNIYASEILFAAQISPFRPASQISLLELKRLINFYQIIMSDAIKYKGTTAKSFLVDNTPGAFWEKLNVYQRHGQKCPNCQAKIHRVKMSGRNTFFCPKCQKK